MKWCDQMEIKTGMLQKVATRHTSEKLRINAGLELVGIYAREKDEKALAYIANDNSGYMPVVKEEAGLQLVDMYSGIKDLKKVEGIAEGKYMPVVRQFAESRADEIKKELFDRKNFSEEDAEILEHIARKDNDDYRKIASWRLINYYTYKRKAGRLRDIAEDEKPPGEGGFLRSVKEVAWQNSKACIMCIVTKKDMGTVLEEYERFIHTTPLRKSSEGKKIIPFPRKKKTRIA